VISGVTVVTTLVCFLPCTRGCGRIERPAFPAPSVYRGANGSCKPRAISAAEIAESYLEFNVIASEAKQSISPRKEEWIASLALAMTVKLLRRGADRRSAGWPMQVGDRYERTEP
jgi:hypothetical protein